MDPIDLPIDAYRDRIVRSWQNGRVTGIAGDTGCGKTTRVPAFLLDAGLPHRGRIVCTEPRRIAAMSSAIYVAEQRGCALGTEVGYHIRHENVTDRLRTDLTYMTEGILLRTLQENPTLRGIGTVILDEVHERGVNQDLLLVLLRRALRTRPELRLVFMSATMDDAIARALDAEIITVPGRTFPIEVEYRPGSWDFVRHAADTVHEVLARDDGDILVFMPDERSIRNTLARINAAHPDVATHALFGRQSPEEQRAVFARQGRSVIVATNIAETSITLDGVTTVIDTGLIKEMRYHPNAAISSLQVVPHSRSGCDQRKGRTGRTAPGRCIRLYSEAEYHDRPRHTRPEILRTKLDQPLLQLARMGYSRQDIESLEFVDAPPDGLWEDAEETLQMLGAMDERGRLTADGHRMSMIPLPPPVTRMVLAAAEHGCTAPVITVAATFSTRPVFVRPLGHETAADAAHAQFRKDTSDFITVLRAVEAWRASSDQDTFAKAHFLHADALVEIVAVEAQIRGILEEQGVPIGDRRSTRDIARAVAAGCMANLLARTNAEGTRGIYAGRRVADVRIHPGSSLARTAPELLVASDIVETSQVFARTAQVVDRAWIHEIVSDRTLRTVKAFRFLKRLLRDADAAGTRTDRPRKRDRRGRRGRDH